MKSFYLTLVALFLFNSSYSQTADWRIFEDGSLRCYEANKQLGSSPLSGIDFRSSHTTVSGDVVYHMDSFSKIRVIPEKGVSPFFEKYYLTGNSIFGNRVVVSPSQTTLYFLNDSIKSVVQDSFVFLNSPRLGVSWVCYEDSLLQIIGNNVDYKLDVSPFGMDSTRTMELAVKVKKTGKIVHYNFKIGKKYGLLQCVDFGDFIRFDHSSYYTKIYSLLPYTEMTEREFFTILPNTETQSGGGRPEFKDGWAISHYFKSKYYLKNGVLVKDVIHKEVRDSNYMDPNKGNHIHIINWDTSSAGVVVQKDTSSMIFNPLPSTFNAMVPYEYNVEFVCENHYRVGRISNQGGSKGVRLSEDTLALTYSEGDMELYKQSYLGHIGLVGSNVTIRPRGGDRTVFFMNYIEMDSCTIGEEIPELNSITKLKYQSIVIYPNPASRMIIVDGLDVYSADIDVFDLMGRQVDVQRIGVGKLDISSLSIGLYTIHINKGGELLRGKFIKN